MTETTSALPKLLKARQFHSRLFAVAIVGLLLVSAPASTNSLTLHIMTWLGYVLVIIGAFGRVYCSSFIGGRKNDAIMRAGPYSVVRNPLYVFSFLATIGIGLQSGMLTVAALLVIAFLVYYPFVVKREENFLSAKFGESYAQYVREVPRWIPNMKLWSEPEESSCMPKFIRRTMGDALIFFLPFPAFALIAILQYSHILPVWLILP